MTIFRQLEEYYRKLFFDIYDYARHLETKLNSAKTEIKRLTRITSYLYKVQHHKEKLLNKVIQQNRVLTDQLEERSSNNHSPSSGYRGGNSTPYRKKPFTPVRKSSNKKKKKKPNVSKVSKGEMPELPKRKGLALQNILQKKRYSLTARHSSYNKLLSNTKLGVVGSKNSSRRRGSTRKIGRDSFASQEEKSKRASRVIEKPQADVITKLARLSHFLKKNYTTAESRANEAEAANLDLPVARKASPTRSMINKPKRIAIPSKKGRKNLTGISMFAKAKRGRNNSQNDSPSLLKSKSGFSKTILKKIFFQGKRSNSKPFGRKKRMERPEGLISQTNVEVNKPTSFDSSFACIFFSSIMTSFHSIARLVELKKVDNQLQKNDRYFFLRTITANEEIFVEHLEKLDYVGMLFIRDVITEILVSHQKLKFSKNSKFRFFQYSKFFKF